MGKLKKKTKKVIPRKRKLSPIMKDMDQAIKSATELSSNQTEPIDEKRKLLIDTLIAVSREFLDEHRAEIISRAEERIMLLEKMKKT